MAIPVPADLKKLDYSYLAQPFVCVPAKDGLNLASMDYPYLAQPFVTNPDAAAGGVLLDIYYYRFLLAGGV
jgi:hypothetical protein